MELTYNHIVVTNSSVLLHIWNTMEPPQITFVIKKNDKVDTNGRFNWTKKYKNNGLHRPVFLFGKDQASYHLRIHKTKCMKFAFYSQSVTRSNKRRKAAHTNDTPGLKWGTMKCNKCMYNVGVAFPTWIFSVLLLLYDIVFYDFVWMKERRNLLGSFPFVINNFSTICLHVINS